MSEEIGFKRTLLCPLCNEYHPVEYQYKGVDILACPKAEEDKITLMSLEYVNDELARYKNVQRFIE